MKTRVDVNGFSKGRIYLAVWRDSEEIALPVIEWDFDEWTLKDWADNELNDAVALDRGMTSDDVSRIIEKHRDDIEDELSKNGMALSEFIERQLTDEYGIGTRYSIATHSYNPECDMNPEDSIIIEDGLLYGNDECIGEDGRLYHYFHPDDSDMVYKCYYKIPEGETDWSDIDYSSPEDIEISDSWGYPE